MPVADLPIAAITAIIRIRIRWLQWLSVQPLTQAEANYISHLARQ